MDQIIDNDKSIDDEVRTPRLRKFRRKLLGLGLTAFVFVGAGASYFLPWKTSSPDINKDGRPDIVQTNVYNNVIPFKGVQLATADGTYRTLKEIEAEVILKHMRTANSELAPYRSGLKEWKEQQ